MIDERKCILTMIVLPGGDPRPSDGTRAAAAASSRRDAEYGAQRRLPAGPARLPPGPAVRGTACPAGARATAGRDAGPPGRERREVAAGNCRAARGERHPDGFPYR